MRALHSRQEGAAAASGARCFRRLLCPPAAAPCHRPLTAGEQYKRDVARMGDMAVALALTRDSGSGRVTIDELGRPRCSYWPSRRDRDSMVKVSEGRSWLHSAARY